MHTKTHTSTGLQQPAAEFAPQTGLNWLLAANAQEASRRRLFRNIDEEEQMLSMTRPLSAQRAYELLGMLLGTLPPAIIFARIFGYGFKTWYGSSSALMFILCLAMNVVCCFVGRAVGSMIGRTMNDLERWSWSKMLLMLPVMGAMWGGITGAAGGGVFFVFGALFGLAIAVPVGMIAFPLFAPLHRLLARGGMIDARHFWPLACGVTMMISAMILGM